MMVHNWEDPQHQEENIKSITITSSWKFEATKTTEDMAKTLHQKGQNHTQHHQIFLDRHPYYQLELSDLDPP